MIKFFKCFLFIIILFTIMTGATVAFGLNQDSSGNFVYSNSEHITLIKYIERLKEENKHLIENNKILEEQISYLKSGHSSLENHYMKIIVEKENIISIKDNEILFLKNREKKLLKDLNVAYTLKYFYIPASIYLGYRLGE